MKRFIIIETVEELLQFSSRARLKGDKSPRLPLGAKLVFSNSYDHVQLEAEGFSLGEGIESEKLIEALIRKAGFEVHIT